MKTKTMLVALDALQWLGDAVPTCPGRIMAHKRLSLLMVCAAVFLLLFSCGDSAAPKDRKRGAIVSDDGLAWLSVPNGAVPSGVTLTIADATATVPVIAMGSVYNIGPTGTQFSSPASLSIMLPYDPTDMWTDITGHDLAITRLDGDRWTTLESTYDPDTRTLTAEITHLSNFGYNLASRHHISKVEDGDPAMVWADYWRGYVIAGLRSEEGQPEFRQPGTTMQTTGVLGQDAVINPPTSPGSLAFLMRRFDPTTNYVLWDAFHQVSVHYYEVAVPGSVPTCGCGSMFQEIMLTEEWQLKYSDTLSRLQINTMHDNRHYVLEFTPEDGQYIPLQYTMFCVNDRCNAHMEGSRNELLKFIGGRDERELPEDGPALSGEVHYEVRAPVVANTLQWDLEPHYEPERWKSEYASLLRDRREFMVRKSMWEEIDQKCARGEMRGIACRAATRMLRNYEATINRWVNDCERIQAALLHQTVTPLLTRSSVFDYSVLQGPVDFCWFTHKSLCSFIPKMPAGSTIWFRERLPAELKALYTVRDLDRLFAP